MTPGAMFFVKDIVDQNLRHELKILLFFVDLFILHFKEQFGNLSYNLQHNFKILLQLEWRNFQFPPRFIFSFLSNKIPQFWPMVCMPIFGKT